MIYLKIDCYKEKGTEWTGSFGTDIHNKFIIKLLMKLMFYYQKVSDKRKLKEKEESKKHFKEFKTYLKDGNDLTKNNIFLRTHFNKSKVIEELYERED